MSGDGIDEYLLAVRQDRLVLQHLMDDIGESQSLDFIELVIELGISEDYRRRKIRYGVSSHECLVREYLRSPCINDRLEVIRDLVLGEDLQNHMGFLLLFFSEILA